MWRWPTLAGVAMLACGHTQGTIPSLSMGGAGSGGTPSLQGGAGSGAGKNPTGDAGGFAPHKPIICGNEQVAPELICDGKLD